MKVMPKMFTESHYSDSRGQHNLPIHLMNRELIANTCVVKWHDLNEMDESEIDDIKYTLGVLGFDIDYNYDGMFITYKHEIQ
jgi:hypothetical protein